MNGVRRKVIAGAIVGLTVLLALVGVGGAQALWSSGATGSGTVTVGGDDLTVTKPLSLTANFSASAGPFAAPFTITGGQLSQEITTATTGIPGSGAEASLAADTTLTAWSTTSGATTCSTTAPSGAVTGTWGTVTTTVWPWATLPANTTATYCVMVAVTAAKVTADAGANLTVSLTLTGTHNGAWSTGAKAAGSVTETTPVSYTAATLYFLDNCSRSQTQTTSVYAYFSAPSWLDSEPDYYTLLVNGATAVQQWTNFWDVGTLTTANLKTAGYPAPQAGKPTTATVSIVTGTGATSSSGAAIPVGTVVATGTITVSYSSSNNPHYAFACS